MKNFNRGRELVKMFLGLAALLSGNVLVLLGYAFRRICTEEQCQSCAANCLILFGHFAAMVSEAYSVMEDVYYLTHCRNITVNGYYALANTYLPYLGHCVMALGYVLEQFEGVEPPLPSAVVLIGHLCVLADPRSLAPDKPSVQIINLIFLVSNILVFLYDFALSLQIPYIPVIYECDPNNDLLELDAKGAIYLTTKNGTFPITLTSLRPQDGSLQDTSNPNILSAAGNNSRGPETPDYWDENSDELLLANYINDTYDLGMANVWKRDYKRSINDAVSKNITSVLENLLKNYENSQLPTHGKGYPTVVQTNILIRSMGPISELDMDYSMDCYFRQYWRDARLSFLGPIQSLSLSIKMLERIWRPDTYFYNGKHSYVHTITVPNKLLRISKHGDILYSMRLTIKAKCPMELRNFPMDRQSCPLILGSYAYSNQQLVYQWQNSQSVNFVPGMTLSQFDLISFPYRNFTFTRREGDFSVLQVSFNLQRHTGYFLIQVYVPCILIVVLSWVSFWIHREATSDRVGLGITTVLTLSTISLDSRTDLPKVRYATALDWFLLMSFFYCIATLLEFAGVHYFTKVGSGEIVIDDSEWEELIEEVGGDAFAARQLAVRRRSSARSATNYGFSLPTEGNPEEQQRVETGAVRLTMERTTQTEVRVPRWRQVLYCLAGDDGYRRQRQREAGSRGHINSVSLIDRAARVLFPASFALLNLFYWLVYAFSAPDFAWSDNPMNSLSH